MIIRTSVPLKEDIKKTVVKEKVKVVLRMRGRQQAYATKGIEIVNNFITMLSENGEKEREPKVEGRNIIVIVQPKKKK